MNDTKRPLTREHKLAMLRILQQGYYTEADAAQLPAYRLTREEAAAMLMGDSTDGAGACRHDLTE